MSATTTARSSRLTLLVAVVGLAAWMTLCDRYFHVATGTVVHYWEPFMGDQTFWVIPIFGLAAIGFVTTAPRFAAPQARPPRFAFELVVMTTIYATSGFVGFEHGTAVTAAFVGLFALRLAASRDRGTLLAVALLLAARYVPLHAARPHRRAVVAVPVLRQRRMGRA